MMQDQPRPTTLVVPCYNEALRLDVAEFVSLVDDEPDVALLFVNDGSRDGTAAILQDLAARRPGRIAVLTLEANGGKAEAVRRGLAQALDDGSAIVGYLDADLATPIAEVRRLLRLMHSRAVDVIIAARVSLLGRRIERNVVRHYLGRIFATGASFALRLTVYDTQCGAKLFRATPALRAALAEPFISRWGFDIELLGRLLVGAGGQPGLPPARIIEEPLGIWRDIRGSKLGLLHMASAAWDLVRIGRDLTRRRTNGPGTGV